MAGTQSIVLHPQYVVDETGTRRSVLLSIEEFESLMELIEDTNDAAAFDRAVEESTGSRDLEDVVADLKRDGLL
ncbi:hypothetical protein IIA79_02975 [bacterium]|nr:hypothetical protein [bacterium]